MIALIRCADDYSGTAQPRTVAMWARIPALRRMGRVRVETGWNGLALTVLRAQLGQQSVRAPDLWLATSDLRLLAFVPYPGVGDAETAAAEALSRAGQMMAFYEDAQQDLERAARDAEAGRFGQAWERMAIITDRDARLYRIVRQMTALEETQADRSNLEELGLVELEDSPESSVLALDPLEAALRAYPNPGPGHFFDDLHVTTLETYAVGANERVNLARELFADDPRGARRTLVPLTQHPLDLPIYEEASAILVALNRREPLPPRTASRAIESDLAPADEADSDPGTLPELPDAGSEPDAPVRPELPDVGEPGATPEGD